LLAKVKRAARLRFHDSVSLRSRYDLDGGVIPLIAGCELSWMSTGQHVITVSGTDITNTTSKSTVTVDNSHPPNTIGKDITVSVDGSDLMETSNFSTTQLV